MKKHTPWNLVIVHHSEPNSGFQVLPRCWGVVRTFAWLGPVAFQARRFSKATRLLPETTEVWIHVAMTGLMLRRLARIQSL